MKRWSKHMKVFISWSGNISLKVALVFRDWLPSVIQSIEPYVSSEDIDKGARWSTDIAKELENSTFGILCVTKENLEAPWLSFEAGITENRLNTSFDVWYPRLEESLNGLKNETIANDELQENEDVTPSTIILEEILELTRDNQKLIRNPNPQLSEDIENIKQAINQLSMRNTIAYDNKRSARKYSSMLFEEVMHMTSKRGSYGFLMILSLFREDFPWIYDMGKEVLDILKSHKTLDEKSLAIREFRDIIEFTCGHPMMRDIYSRNKESLMFMKEMPYMLSRYLDDMLEQYS